MTGVNRLLNQLVDVLGTDSVLSGDTLRSDYTHDENLTAQPVVPLAVVLPDSTSKVSKIMKIAYATQTPVVLRGSGTGLSGAARPVENGIVIAFEKMASIDEIDELNRTAVVQPGVTLEELNRAVAPKGLVYPVFPGEASATLGGNIGTNAGGMRAITYGVTRHHVLGLEVVLADGRVMRTGGKVVKSSSGYDMTQLMIGSEGTLGVVTQATLKLHPLLPFVSTLLAPFSSLEKTASAVQRILCGGVTPLMLEYLDMLTMGGITSSAEVDLGIPQEIQSGALAYLIVVLESSHQDRLERDVEMVAGELGDGGALDVYVLPPSAGSQLVQAREKAFFVAKAAGADDIVDAVVPRAQIFEFMSAVSDLAGKHGAFVAGCGHVGDGNVHISIFKPDREEREEFLGEVFETALSLGGAISGEHGIGTEKQKYFLELEDPVKLELMQSIKAAFDPLGILGPRRLADRCDQS